MTYARKSLVSLQDTAFYHVVARCVRRAWLWGRDPNTGRDYSHRKLWVLERLKLLASMFAIDVCAHAIMSNHYHLALHVDQPRARAWTQREVVHQWLMLFNAPPLVQRWLDGAASKSERARAERIIEIWRARLYDISWFMRCLNEHLARLANAEDNCKGRFWEGRFKSQALLDEAGLLTAMAYIDLNPVRAGIAASPSESDFTSIYQRIQEFAAGHEQAEQSNEATPRVRLMPFRPSDISQPVSNPSIPFTLKSYLELLRWTSHRVAATAEGLADQVTQPLLRQLMIDPNAWQESMRPQGNVFGRALGRLDRMRLHAQTLGQAWIRGLRQAEVLYCT